MERVYLSINVVIVVFILIISVIFVADPDSHANEIDLVYFIVGFAFFFFNLLILFQLGKMANFYINVLSHS